VENPFANSARPAHARIQTANRPASARRSVGPRVPSRDPPCRDRGGLAASAHQERCDHGRKQQQYVDQLGGAAVVPSTSLGAHADSMIKFRFVGEQSQPCEQRTARPCRGAGSREAGAENRRAGHAHGAAPVDAAAPSMRPPDERRNQRLDWAPRMISTRWPARREELQQANREHVWLVRARRRHLDTPARR